MLLRLCYVCGAINSSIIYENNSRLGLVRRKFLVSCANWTYSRGTWRSNKILPLSIGARKFSPYPARIELIHVKRGAIKPFHYLKNLYGYMEHGYFASFLRKLGNRTYSREIHLLWILFCRYEITHSIYLQDLDVWIFNVFTNSWSCVVA